MKLDKKIWVEYNQGILNGYEQFCVECLKRVSFTNPCPVCRGVEDHKKVNKLPQTVFKRKNNKGFTNRDAKDKRCSRCNKVKPTSEFYLNKRGHFEGKCKQCKSIINNNLQKEKRNNKNH